MLGLRVLSHTRQLVAGFLVLFFFFFFFCGGGGGGGGGGARFSAAVLNPKPQTPSPKP